MSAFRTWQSTIGKKMIMGATGIFLMLFLVVHLAGNLTLFVPGNGDLFNLYAHKLESTKPLLYIAEIGLIAVFLFHVASGVRVYLEKRRARTDRYVFTASKYGPSKMTVSSRSMIVTGIVLLIFVPLHVAMFKYGAHYETVINGEPVRDLYRLVVEEFKNPVIAFGYAAVMFILGMHLRHGFWSALQSLGAMSPRWTPVVYTGGLVFAILLAGGFLVLPLYMYFVVPLPVAGMGGGM